MENPTLLQKIESYLFYEGGSASRKSILTITGATNEELSHALHELSAIYSPERGITLIVTESEVSLRVSKQCAGFIETLHKEGLAKEIGPASLEVLGILLYRGNSSQAEIDSIRGVNSAFSLRVLRMRGLIARLQEGTQVTYTISPDALAHLGISSIEDIPNRDEIVASLSSFEAKSHKAQEEARADMDEGDVE